MLLLMLLVLNLKGCWLTTGVKGAFGIVTGILSSKVPPINIHLFNDAHAMEILRQQTYESDGIIGSATDAVLEADPDVLQYHDMLEDINEKEKDK